jgi:hypothetical protein
MIVKNRDSQFNLARIIHEGVYCNRRYVAATSLTAGGARRSVGQHTVSSMPPCLAHSYKGTSPFVESPRRGHTPFGTPRRGVARLPAPRARLACHLGDFIKNLRE